MCSPPSNEPLPAKQIAALRKRILSRQKTLNKLNTLINEETGVFLKIMASIRRLEPAISRAKHAREVQKGLMTNLLQMLSTIESSDGIPEPNSTVGSEAMAIMTVINGQIEKNERKINEHVKQVKENIYVLDMSIKEMEMQIYGDRLIYAECSEHMAHLQRLQGATIGTIKFLKARLNHAKDTPVEIWVKIFRFRVDADIRDFFENPESNTFPFVALRLSHVCRSWRDTIFSEECLWYYVPVYAHQIWGNSKMEFTNYLSKMGKMGARHLMWDTTRYQGFNLIAPHANVDDGIFQRYLLSIILNGRNDNFRGSSITLQKPEMLRFQFLSTPSNDIFSNVSRHFTNYKGLEIVIKGEYEPISLDLATRQPQVTILKLDMATFRPFNITQYLSPSLQEVHITHDGLNSSLSTNQLHLPALKVLGVTPPDTGFVNSLVLPLLRKLILYGPKQSRVPIISLTQFSSTVNFKIARTLELRRWVLFRPPENHKWDITQPISDIVENILSFETLRIVDSAIDGSKLFKVIKNIKKETRKTVSKLDTVVIHCCSGITRNQCDSIGQLVNKMEIYV